MSHTVTYNSISLASAPQDKIEKVEGNIYFPPSSINSSLFTPSQTKTTCGWKGVASYYNLKLEDGTEIKDVAWYYPEPKSGASNIKDFVAFYKNKVQIS